MNDEVTMKPATNGVYDDRSEEHENWQNCISSALKRAEKMFDRAEAKGLPTGFRYLDDQLGVLRNGQLIAISSRPSVGGDELAREMVECIADGQDVNGLPMTAGHDRKHAVLVFSLAMSAKNWVSQMMFSRTGVDRRRLERGLYTHEQRVEASNRLFLAAEWMRGLPVVVDDSDDLDIRALEFRARDLAGRLGIELIVIDNLQLLNSCEVSDAEREYELGEICTRLRDLARELDLPIVLVSRLRDATYAEDDQRFRPLESRVWEMGIAERLADVVLLLRRPCLARHNNCHDKLLAVIDIVKNRDGATGKVELNCFEGHRFGNRKPDGWSPYDDDDAARSGDDGDSDMPVMI